jgi:hypothetical protein
MTRQTPCDQARTDEILVTAPPGRCLCNSLEHRRLNCLAEGFHQQFGSWTL